MTEDQSPSGLSRRSWAMVPAKVAFRLANCSFTSLLEEEEADPDADADAEGNAAGAAALLPLPLLLLGAAGTAPSREAVGAAGAAAAAAGAAATGAVNAANGFATAADAPAAAAGAGAPAAAPKMLPKGDGAGPAAAPPAAGKSSAALLPALPKMLLAAASLAGACLATEARKLAKASDEDGAAGAADGIGSDRDDGCCLAKLAKMSLALCPLPASLFDDDPPRSDTPANGLAAAELPAPVSATFANKLLLLDGASAASPLAAPPDLRPFSIGRPARTAALARPPARGPSSSSSAAPGPFAGRPVVCVYRAPISPPLRFTGPPPKEIGRAHV